MVKNVLLVCCCLLIIFACGKKEKPEQQSISSDDKIIEIEKEISKGDYEKALLLIDMYLPQIQNEYLLYLKGTACSKLVSKLNKESRTNISKKFEKYNIYFSEDKFYYNGYDFKNLFENYPESRWAEKSYYEYITLQSPQKPEYWQKYLNKYQDGVHKDEAYLRIGDANVSNPQKAMESYKFLVENFPHSKYRMEAVLRIGALTRHTKDYNTAIKYFEELTKDKKLSGIGFYEIAETYYKQKDIISAIKNYEKAIKNLNNEVDLKIFLNRDETTVNEFISEIEKKLKILKTELSFEQTLSKSKIATVIGLNVRVRKAAGATSLDSIMTTVNTGDKLIVLEKSKRKEKVDEAVDFWYKVRLRNSIEGWVFGKYLVLFEEN